MVNVSNILVALVIFAILLAASILLLSGVVPSVNDLLNNTACGFFKICPNPP